MLFPTTIAGSLPKPEWLAEPNTLWAPWKSKGEELARAKRDATMLAIKLQEMTGKRIKPENFKTVRTVGDVIGTVKQLMSAGATVAA